jgi:MFS family permease
MEANENPMASAQIPDFRWLLAGRLLATLAVLIQTIAVGWQIYALTHKPLMLGLLGLAEALPAIGVGLYAGHVADVMDRRRIALVAVVGLLIAMLGLWAGSTYITNTDVLMPIVFFCVAITGFARGFYNPSVFGMVSDIIPRELYGNAAAWNTAVWQASAVGGPILGGLIYVAVGPSATYFLSSALLMCSLMCFVTIKSRTVLHKTEEKVGIAENIKEGLNFVFSNEVIVGAMAMDLFAVLFGGVVALLPIFADQVFKMGPQALGVLRAAPSVGSFLIAAILTRHPISRETGHVFMASVAGFGLCMIGFGLSRNFYISFSLLVISGILDGISMWTRSTVYQLLTPSNMKGRMAAVNQMFIGSSNEIGEFESGVAAQYLGLIPSVIFGGCMTLLVVAVAAVKAPKLRKLHVHDLYKEAV